MNIQEYIKSAMDGDIKSYEYLINKFQGYTINYAFGILKDYQLAEDAAQETFILLFNNIKNLKESSAFLTWLKKLTITCCNRITRRKRLEIYTEDYEEPYIDDNPVKSLETEEKMLLVQQSLEELTEVQKEAIMLSYFMDKSYADIAVLLGITETAVSNRIYAGKKKLKKVMLKNMNDYVEEIVMKREEFTRKVLEQVPNITTQDPKVQENFQFCGCLRAVMKYMKKDSKYDFIYFAGVSGALFSNVWTYNPIWEYSESTVSWVPFEEKNEIISSTFRTIGYECEIVSKEEVQKSKRMYLKNIVESLNKGYPVLTYGIVGPPTCSLITGYDEDGDILIGWSAFQDGEHGISDGYEPCGYFRKRNGLEESHGLIFFREKGAPVSDKAAAEIALTNIRKVLQLKKTEHNVYGYEAFKAWAEAILEDKYFKDDAEKLAEYADVHCGMKTIVMTGCEYMNEFLKRLKQYDDENTVLYDKLLSLSDKEKDILGEFWRIEPQFFFDEKRLLQRDYRERLAGIILKAGDIYAKMTEAIKE